jgi:hypothetical protein
LFTANNPKYFNLLRSYNEASLNFLWTKKIVVATAAAARDRSMMQKIDGIEDPPALSSILLLIIRCIL